MTALRLIHLCTAGALLAGMAISPQPSAQDYPTKPVRVIVPFGPGGGSDTAARMFTQKLANHFGQPFVIENRPGAGAMVGTKALVESAPDGYTIMISSSSWLTTAAVSKPAFDPLNNITPIMELAYNPFILAVHPSLPVKSTRELIVLARKRPNELAYGIPGVGSITHMAMVYFLDGAQLKMLAVPYKSGGAVMPDVLAGRTQLVLAALVNVIPHAQSGKLRLLGISAAKRSKLLPDVPPIHETVPGYTVTSWFGVVTPKGTPQPIVERLYQAFRVILKDPSMHKAAEAQGLTLTGSTIAEIATQVREDYARWTRLVDKGGIQVK